MTHWKQLVNYDYLGAYSLNGKDRTLTIKKVVQEMVTGTGGKKEQCIICYFTDSDKPMILNRTNCKMIQKLHGTPIIEEWAGKKITIYTTTTSVAGETVECLRIRPVITETVVKLCLDCGNEITAASGMDALSVAARTKANYGVELCASCGAKRKSAANE